MNGRSTTPTALLALDWGTTALRGARVDAQGLVLEQRSFERGILSVAPGGFAQVFDESFGDWVRAGAGVCLISGMAGSKQGWMEAPYCACPAGFGDIASQLRWINDARLSIPTAIVPGLCCEHPCDLPGLPGLPDVMRGEEVQILGAMHLTGLGEGLFILPGTHSKWARVRQGQVTGFQTFMTGEFFALLSRHSLLERSIAHDAPFDASAFALGLARARQGSGLLHNAFGTRTLSLFSRLDAAQLTSYLSGLVIGEEMRALALPDVAEVAEIVLIGSDTLTRRYAQALETHGLHARSLGAEATWAGLHALARQLQQDP